MKKKYKSIPVRTFKWISTAEKSPKSTSVFTLTISSTETSIYQKARALTGVIVPRWIFAMKY